VLPPDGSDIAVNVRKINREMKAFSATLARRPQWLVFNKVDLLGPKGSDRNARAHCQKIVKKLKWTKPWFAISAATKHGTEELGRAVMQWIEEQPAPDSGPRGQAS